MGSKQGTGGHPQGKLKYTYWKGKPMLGRQTTNIYNHLHPPSRGTLEPQKLACERQSYTPSKLHIQWYHASMKSPSWKCLRHGNRQVLHIRAFTSPEVVTHLLTPHCPMPKLPVVIIPALPCLSAPIAQVPGLSGTWFFPVMKCRS